MRLKLMKLLMLLKCLKLLKLKMKRLELTVCIHLPDLAAVFLAGNPVPAAAEL